MGKLLFLIDGFAAIIILSDYQEFSLFYFIGLTLQQQTGGTLLQYYI
jgi:hypothetical protein